MCDFKVGDEIVYVGPIDNNHGEISGLPVRSVHICRSLHVHPASGNIGVKVDAHPRPIMSSSFRKVQRRDLTAWLKTATKFEEPKRGKVSA